MIGNENNFFDAQNNQFQAMNFIEVIQIFDITKTDCITSLKVTYLDRYVHCNSSCLADVVLQFHESLLCM